MRNVLRMDELGRIFSQLSPWCIGKACVIGCIDISLKITSAMGPEYSQYTLFTHSRSTFFDAFSGASSGFLGKSGYPFWFVVTTVHVSSCTADPECQFQTWIRGQGFLLSCGFWLKSVHTFQILPFHSRCSSVNHLALFWLSKL